jgi:hypothetical protein
LDLYAGSGESAPEENVSGLLEALAADVERSEAPGDIAEKIANDIRTLLRSKSVPKVEEKLIDIERDLMDRILASVPLQEREAIVQPIKKTSTTLLWRGVDAGLIDGTVNGVGLVVRGWSAVLRRLQTGSVRAYAMSLFAGAVVMLGYYLWVMTPR